MDYVILIGIVLGCVLLFWILSKRSLKGAGDNLESIRKAAEHGDVFAQYALAVRYKDGQGVPRDMDEAIQWFRKAAGHGHVEAQYTLATILETADSKSLDIAEAHAWLNKAALQGHQAAQTLLASEKWKKAVPQVPVDPPDSHPAHTAQELTGNETLETLIQQAEDGDVNAQYNLGIMFYNGEGVEKDYANAMHWFVMAANQGDAEAQFNLGIMIGRGEGVTKDPKVSRQWFEKAAEQGHPEATEIVAKLRKNLTPTRR